MLIWQHPLVFGTNAEQTCCSRVFSIPIPWLVATKLGENEFQKSCNIVFPSPRLVLWLIIRLGKSSGLREYRVRLASADSHLNEMANIWHISGITFSLLFICILRLYKPFINPSHTPRNLPHSFIINLTLANVSIVYSILPLKKYLSIKYFILI